METEMKEMKKILGKMLFRNMIILMTLFSFFKKFYINNNDRTAHFFGHSKLNPLDIVDFMKENRRMKIWKLK